MVWQAIAGTSAGPRSGKIIRGSSFFVEQSAPTFPRPLESPKTHVSSKRELKRLERGGKENSMAKMKVAPSEQTGRLGNRRAGNPATACRHVRIRVQACGICYSDHLTKDNLWPGLQYPRVPGHEVAGVIDEAGAGKACRVHSGYARRKAATSSLRA